MELAAVPWHPGEIPGEEAQPRPVRRDPGVRIEVPSLGDDPRLRGAVGRHCDELVQAIFGPVALGVTLADADPQRSVGGHAAVGEAMTPVRYLGRDRNGSAPWIHPVQALVVEVRAERDPATNAERPPPVSW